MDPWLYLLVAAEMKDIQKDLSFAFADPEQTWVGNFQPGLGGIDAVFEHPNKRDCIVIAEGQGYVINPANRACIETFGLTINIAIPVLELSAIVFGDDVAFQAFGGAAVCGVRRGFPSMGYKIYRWKD